MTRRPILATLIAALALLVVLPPRLSAQNERPDGWQLLSKGLWEYWRLPKLEVLDELAIHSPASVGTKIASLLAFKDGHLNQSLIVTYVGQDLAGISVEMLSEPVSDDCKNEYRNSTESSPYRSLSTLVAVACITLEGAKTRGAPMRLPPPPSSMVVTSPGLGGPSVRLKLSPSGDSDLSVEVVPIAP
jgi:hypothetical protein